MSATDALTGLLILACGAGTYFWRGLGVWIADRVDVEGDWFKWITCVAYAMLAGLVARVVVLPVGALEQTALVHRLIGIAIGVVVFRLARRNLIAGVFAGAGSLPLLEMFFRS